MARGTLSLACTISCLLGFTPAFAEWSAVAENKVSYTDDVFQFSAARRLSLSEDPSQPTVVPLDKPQDVIVEPSLEVFRSSDSRWGKTELSAKAAGFLYTEHPIFDHGNYRLQLKQTFAPDTSALLRYRYVPNLFLGPNFSRRFSPSSRQEERVTSHTWRIQIERQVTDAWTLTLVARYGLRLYNEVFAQRDTHFWTVGPQVAFHAASWATLTLAYLYERGLADGRDQPQFRDDVSYRQHFLSFSGDLRLAEPLSLKLSYVFRPVEFTSDLAGDPNRGREDVTHQGLGELRYQLTEKLTVTAGFQRTQRTSTASASGFFDDIVSFGAQYRFN